MLSCVLGVTSGDVSWHVQCADTSYMGFVCVSSLMLHYCTNRHRGTVVATAATRRCRYRSSTCSSSADSTSSNSSGRLMRHRHHPPQISIHHDERNEGVPNRHVASLCSQQQTHAEDDSQQQHDSERLRAGVPQTHVLCSNIVSHSCVRHQHESTQATHQQRANESCQSTIMCIFMLVRVCTCACTWSIDMFTLYPRGHSPAASSC